MTTYRGKHGTLTTSSGDVTRFGKWTVIERPSLAEWSATFELVREYDYLPPDVGVSRVSFVRADGSVKVGGCVVKCVVCEDGDLTDGEPTVVELFGFGELTDSRLDVESKVTHA